MNNETVATLVLNTILDIMQNELSQMQDPTDSFDFTNNKSISAIELSNWLSTVTFDLVETERLINNQPKSHGYVDRNDQLKKYRAEMIRAINAKFKYVGLFDNSKDIFQSPFQLTKSMNNTVDQFNVIVPTNAKQFAGFLKACDFNNQDCVNHFVKLMKEDFNDHLDKKDPYFILTVASVKF